MKLKKLLCIITFCFVCLTAGCSSNNKNDSNIISSYETERENSNSESSNMNNRQEADISEKDDMNQNDNNPENHTSKKNDSEDNQENNNLKKNDSEDNQENSNLEKNDSKDNQENNNLNKDNSDSNPENHTSKKDNTNQDDNTNTNEEDNGFYQTSTSRTSSEVENFAETIKSLVLAKDWSGLSNLIAYPISIDGAFYNDSAGFLSIDFENNLNPDFISALEAETCHEMFNNWQGISMGANGEIWFKDVYSDESNSTLQITAINGIIK